MIGRLAPRLLPLAIFPLLALVIHAQNGDDRARQRLRETNETLRASRQRLAALEAAARQQRSALGSYRSTTSALDRRIDSLQGAGRRLAESLIRLRSERDSVAAHLERSRRSVAEASRQLLRQRVVTPAAGMLLMPREQAAYELRRRLVDRFAARQRERVEELRRVAGDLRERDSLLGIEQAEAATRLAARQREIARLLGLQRSVGDSLARSEEERRGLVRLIEQKNGEARQIGAMIARLERRGREEREKEKEKEKESERVRPKGETKRETTERPSARTRSRKSSSGRLRLRWPTSERRIVERYGERRNPRTGTVTINPGINIAAREGSTARAAAAGSVSVVSWLPGYGTVVIVEHEGGWRTVYGNLANASVSRGAKVDAGDPVGAVGPSLDATSLHFEVWRGNQRLDPATVLE